MAPYFYLSCSAADDSELLGRFFENLSLAVRSWLRLPATEEVGFFDPTGASGQGRRPEKDEAVRTSQTMVAMVSPNYFQSADAGRERQIFEGRKRSIEKSGNNPSPIIPAIWIPYQYSTARIFDREQYDWSESFKAYQLNGLMKLMELRGSLPSLGDQYRNVVVELAKQIIERAGTVKLPPLDSTQTSKDVESASEEPQEVFDSSQRATANQKFYVAIVDNKQEVGEMLEEYLSAHDCECHLWLKAKTALNEIPKGPIEGEVFDVVLVDLELDLQEMQGLALVEKLAADDNSPLVIAMSPGLSNSESIEALKTGAVDVIPKPFDLLQVEERIRNAAHISRERRKFRQNPGRKLSPRERPVFLSYSHIDRRTAKILKTQLEVRGIGVWYAPDILAPDDPLRTTISSGLDKAQVFVALVTDNFARSAWCMVELMSYQHDPNKTVIPVLDGLIYRMKNSELIREITTRFVYDLCDITFDRFADGLTLLLGKIQQGINGKTANVSEKRNAPAATLPEA